jgi:hypothetical protein
MWGAEPAQAFDLPDHRPIDRVVIYPADDLEDYDFEAVPFVLEAEYDDGRKWFNEPEWFTATDPYRQAVAERADTDIDDVLLEREIPISTFDTYGDHSKI